MTQEKPAAKAIRLLGIEDIANECGLTVSAVRKWQSKLGGRIPAMHQARVLNLAVRKGQVLSARDIIGVAA